MLLDGAHVGVTVRTLTSNSRRNQSPIAYRRFHKSTSENRLAPIDGQSNLRFTRKPILPFTRSAHSVSFASSEALLETTLLRQKDYTVRPLLACTTLSQMAIECLMLTSQS